ncbi:helix-turn-helix domain-containing protein [Hamadaea tsunoensis]|uniref:helix-turn-helix domain-containing protein n=1 Tax=Hamadaea tsunoensis TaxID=53368 RepID=UPI000687F7BB|nr:helix-turn-helix domain-containing protein [Hamadaea tsunoensis]
MDNALAKVPLVARTVAVLRVLAAQNRPASLAEIARETNLPKSSVHRLLGALENAGAVERVGAGYRIGGGLGDALQRRMLTQHSGLRAAALPHLADLHHRSGLPASLAVRDGVGVILLDTISSRGDRVWLVQQPYAPAAEQAAHGVLTANRNEAVHTGVTHANSGPLHAMATAVYASSGTAVAALILTGREPYLGQPAQETLLRRAAYATSMSIRRQAG